MAELDVRKVLELISNYVYEQDNTGHKASSKRPLLIGTIDREYVSGLPRVLFDGEQEMSVKGYPWLSTYTPRPGNRVQVVPVGQSYVIVGLISLPFALPL